MKDETLGDKDELYSTWQKISQFIRIYGVCHKVEYKNVLKD